MSSDRGDNTEGFVIRDEEREEGEDAAHEISSALSVHKSDGQSGAKSSWYE
jgi:hypothetical protein